MSCFSPVNIFCESEEQNYNFQGLLPIQSLKQFVLRILAYKRANQVQSKSLISSLTKLDKQQLQKKILKKQSAMKPTTNTSIQLPHQNPPSFLKSYLQKDVMLELSNSIFNSSVSRETLLRKSKETTWTNVSTNTLISSEAVDENIQSQLEFTFYPETANNCYFQKYRTKSKRFQYSSKSIQCLLLYALNFNHLHLEQIQQNLPNIKAVSFNCYHRIKKYLLTYDELASQNAIQEFIFPQSLYRILENNTLSLQTRKECLKRTITKLNASIASTIILSLAYEGKSDKHCSKENSQQIIEKFARNLGIRIQYEKKFQKHFFGAQKAFIKIFLKESPQTGLTTLNTISCFEDEIS